MDEHIDGMRNGLTGKLEGPTAASTVAARSAFMDEVNRLDDQVNGGLYQQARALYSGPARSREALLAGRGFLREDPAVTAADVSALTPGDQQFAQTGAAQGLKDRVLAPGVRDSQDIAGTLNTKGVMARLNSVFPNNSGAVNDFATRLSQESQLAQNKNFVLSGSNMVNKAAELGDLAGDPGVLISLLQGHPIDAAKFAAKQLYNVGTGQGPNYSTAAAQRLFTADPAANAKTLADVLALRQAQAQALQAQGNRFGLFSAFGGNALGDLPRTNQQ